MADVSNSDLMGVLLEIKSQTGEMKANIASTAEALKQHVADDKEMAKALFSRIETLQFGQAKQRGFLSALAMVGGVLGAGVGYVIDRITFGHH